AVSAVSEGGLIRRVFEMAYGSGRGVTIDLRGMPGRHEDWVFGESLGSIVLELSLDSPLLQLPWVPLTVLGYVTASPVITIQFSEKQSLTLPVEELVRVWKRPFREVLA
ncbi:MAG: hypothetical protein HYS57_00620, partial [Parcubacteria group bacterium]|nr:hypothetical protein [Parcubacteria group bacterium]